MGPSGVFVQFTYGLLSPIPREVCANRYTAVRSKPILRNLPPAFVWTYRLDRRSADAAKGRVSLARFAARDRLIVALDMADAAEARRLVERIGDSAVFYKVGMELAYGGGLPLVPELAAAGKQVFLDLKLHDIPNTVERATAQAAKLGARFLTVHAYPQTMRAAVAGARGSGTQILAVTVLTSYDDADLSEACYRFGVVETVKRRAEQARISASTDWWRAPRRRRWCARRSARRCFLSPPASGPRAQPPATRSASRRQPRRSATAPTTLSLAGR